MTHSRVRVPRPAAGTAREYHFPPFRRTELDNGLRVVVAPVAKLPLITIAAVVDAGAVCDPPGMEGIAQLTAKLLTEGTASSDGGELALRFEKLGASVESYADWDLTAVTITALSHRYEQAVELLAEVLREPAFAIREVDRLKGERMAELLQLRAEPRGLADESFSKLLYDARSRYSKLDGGSDRSVAAIERDDIVRFHGDRFHPGSTTIIVAGDVDAEGAAHVIQTRLGGWPSGAAPPIVADATPARSERTVWVVHKEDAPQTELRLGQVGVPRNHPDYFAVVVMNAILGGLFNSRINLNLREKHGYTYGAFSGFDWRKTAGPFVVATAVRNDVTGAAAKEALAEIDRMREAPVSEDELSLATSYLDGVFPIRYETTGAIASALANLTVYELPDAYLNQYRAHVRAVSAGAVHAAARSHLNPSSLQIVAVGDAALIGPQLEALSVGPVRVAEAEI